MPAIAKGTSRRQASTRAVAASEGAGADGDVGTDKILRKRAVAEIEFVGVGCRRRSRTVEADVKVVHDAVAQA